MKKKILVLGTGGTIACVESENGFKPGLSSEELVRQIPQVKKIADIETDNFKDVPDIVSSNIQPEYWVHMARDVFKSLPDYDGIVITHGTDTLAYTSSMLSFMLQNLDKPVIVTGAQRTMGEPGTDAKKNLYDAINFACEGIGGVYVVFHGKIMKGCRVSKLKAQSFDAFDSVGYPDIGYINTEGQITYNNDSLTPVSKGGAILDNSLNPNIFILRLVPGLRPEILDKFLELGYEGVVIILFGDSGIPTKGTNLLPGVKKLIDNGIVVIVTSQSTYEYPELERYEEGRKTLDLGAIPAYDMTKESITTKLMWVLGHTNDLREARKMMLKNYCDELDI